MTIAKKRYDEVKKHKLCFGCLGKAYSIKECLVNPLGIDGCDKKHNQFFIENRSGRIPIHHESTNNKSAPNQSMQLCCLQRRNLQLSVAPNQTISQCEVISKIGQDNFNMRRPKEYKSLNKKCP